MVITCLHVRGLAVPLVVANCCGPYCVLSVEAIIIILDEGYDALRLEEGFLSVKKQGFGRKNLEFI